MNNTLTSREAILTVGKEIATQSGLQALNMREVAKRCGVAVGSVYNYFPSKGELIAATIESVWSEIIYNPTSLPPSQSFVETVCSLFETIRKGSEKYPSFFTLHSMSFAGIDRHKGREVMNQYFGQIKSRLLLVLKEDQNVRHDAFTPDFTAEYLVDFAFSNILMLLMQSNPSCRCLSELITRSIY